jgi:hypothetical protein
MQNRNDHIARTEQSRSSQSLCVCSLGPGSSPSLSVHQVQCISAVYVRPSEYNKIESNLLTGLAATHAGHPECRSMYLAHGRPRLHSHSGGRPLGAVAGVLLPSPMHRMKFWPMGNREVDAWSKSHTVERDKSQFSNCRRHIPCHMHWLSNALEVSDIDCEKYPIATGGVLWAVAKYEGLELLGLAFDDNISVSRKSII